MALRRPLLRSKVFIPPDSESILFEVTESKIFGRCLIAKQDIKRGSVILKETPLIVYPRINEHQKTNKKPEVTCLSCYQVLDSDLAVECAHCKWRFCSSQCSKSKYHGNLECQVFKRNKILPSRRGTLFLFLVRALIIKSKEPDKWNEILKLQSMYDGPDAERDEEDVMSSELAWEYLSNCSMEISLSEIQHLQRIFKINNFSFGGSWKDNATYKPMYCALYAKSSLFSHSCAPNVRFKGIKRFEESHTLGFFANVTIKAGEMLTISYNTNFTLEGTEQRRVSIYNAFGFRCKCCRCDDPTELSTYYSGLKCPKCPKGWVNPRKVFSKLSYMCNYCGYFLKWKKAVKIEDKFTNKLESLHEKVGQTGISKLDELISKSTSTYKLHSNHYLVIDAIEHWLSACDFHVLLESTPNAQVEYEKIFQRAKRSLDIRISFGEVLQRINLEIILCNVILLFKFKTQHDFCIPSPTDKASSKNKQKIKSIMRALRHHIGRRGKECADPEIISFVRDLEKRYNRSFHF